MVWTGAGLALATQRPIDSRTGWARAAPAGSSLLSAPRKLWLGTVDSLELPRRLRFPWVEGEKCRWPDHLDTQGSCVGALRSHGPILNPSPPLAE